MRSCRSVAVPRRRPSVQLPAGIKRSRGYTGSGRKSKAKPEAEIVGKLASDVEPRQVGRYPPQ